MALSSVTLGSALAHDYALLVLGWQKVRIHLLTSQSQDIYAFFGAQMLFRHLSMEGR